MRGGDNHHNITENRLKKKKVEVCTSLNGIKKATSTSATCCQQFYHNMKINIIFLILYKYYDMKYFFQ